ncbi:MAG TPA: cytochrome c peroxidase [Gemmatimonadaceae bacterium]|nr:cytochrome c peroxidase [Gemmatimonadaceae bacterium]
MQRDNTVASVLALILSACAPLVAVPPRFPPAPAPADNAITSARLEFGKKLFYDKRLSRTGEVSCASCHQQELAFADPRPVSIGVHGRTGTRNAPPLINLAWNTSFFWDGGVKTLEQQAVGPITNPLEMDMTMGEVVQRVSADPEYVRLSRAAYGSELRPEVVTKGIASFLRSLVSGKSRFDRYLEGDAAALTASEKRGADIALGERGDCFHCHVGFNLTNNAFANNGLVSADTGRTRITEKTEDEGKFKVPTLRNVALTAPYMHDGSLATLRDVIDFYSRGGQGHPNTDPIIRPLNLSGQEKEDLLAFLGSLTDEGFVKNPRFAP